MSNKAVLLATSAVLAFAVAGTPAFAQTSEFGDIVVTATKRQQTLQEAPVAVTVTTADVIEKARLVNLNDLQSVVPTLRVSTLQNSGNTTFSLRGFGSGTNNVGIEPAVGVFIDGVYRSRAAAAINNLPNLDRVEVLPGPQSTLFGKNASAGVINIVTSAPSFEREGFVEIGIGNNNLYEASGYYSDAITDELAFSVGGGFEIADGYFDVTGADDNNEVDRVTLRGQLLYEPIDALSLRLIADYNTIDENCCGTSLAISGPVSDTNRANGLIPASTDPFSYTANANSASENDIEDYGVSLQADYDLGNHTITSITAIRQNDWFNEVDSDFSSLDLLGSVFQDVETTTFTQELRFASDLGGKYEYMVGGYYFDEDVDLDSGALWGADARAFVGTLGADEAILEDIALATGTNSAEFFVEGLGSIERFEQENTAFSIFGNFDYKPIDRLTLSVGVNYTEDDKDVSLDTIVTDSFSQVEFLNFSVDNSGAIDAGDGDGANLLQVLSQGAFTDEMVAGNALAFRDFNVGLDALVSAIEGLQGLQFLTQATDFPNEVESGSRTDDDVTWSVRAAYEVNDNWNVYGAVATGFNSASFNLTRNTAPFASDQAALTTAGLFEFTEGVGTRFAEPEESLVYELGVKARFDKGAFNVTVFDQSIDNFQSTVFQGAGFVLANAEEQSTTGVEWDSVYTPTENWTINFGGAYLDAEYDSFTNGNSDNDSIPDDLTGQTPAGIPELALSTALTYSHDFVSGTTGYMRVDHDWQDTTTLVDNLPDSLTRTVSEFNASAGLTFENGVALQIWGRNIFDDEYFTSGFPTPLFSAIEASAGVPSDFTSVNAYPNQPATYGVSARYTF